ncbi:hypothetical protein ACKVE0_07980 [Acinetobacter albensis]|uniref:Uncharacterized protein n=1 Tax=Acinetobacter albensis TaxID=1673609 RepID=A0ABW9JWN2_9GAMM
MLESLLKINSYLNACQNFLEEQLNKINGDDGYHRALTTIRRLVKGLNFSVVDKINNLENDYLDSENLNFKNNEISESELEKNYKDSIYLVDEFNANCIQSLHKLNIENAVVNSDLNELIFIMDELKDIREKFSKFYKNLKVQEFEIINDTSELNSKLEKKIKLFSQRANVIEKNISNIENNYAEILGNMNKVYEDLNVFNDKLYKMNSYVTELKTNLNKEINDSVKSIDIDNSIKIREIVEKFNYNVEENTKNMTLEIESISNTSRSFNEFISEETSIKLTNNFKTKSETERNWYYGFNAISAIIIGVAIQMSYSSLTEFAKNHAENFTQLDLYYLGIRLLFSFLIFSTIAFTNKLANKHYFHWKKNESTYLKLTALKSFIADMSPEKQQEIHEKLIDVYFGKEDLDPTIYKKYDNSSENLLKLFADKIPPLGNNKNTD